jgi:hypothetical protein
MDRNLWGITLYLWSFLLQMSLNNVGSKLPTTEANQVKSFINKMNCFDLTFRPYSPYKIPASLIASGWHYLYRVRPFRYYPSYTNQSNHLLRNIFIFVLLVVIINCFYGAL